MAPMIEALVYFLGSAYLIGLGWNMHRFVDDRARGRLVIKGMLEHVMFFLVILLWPISGIVGRFI